jgi:hypothetical protein
MKTLAGFKHIIDDGDCTDHGYFIPKPTGKAARSEGGTSFVDVPQSELLAALAQLSDQQTARLRQAGL